MESMKNNTTFVMHWVEAVVSNDYATETVDQGYETFPNETQAKRAAYSVNRKPGFTAWTSEEQLEGY